MESEDVIENSPIHLRSIYPPIFILVGTFGNSVSLAVFFQRRLMKRSNMVYLAALAVADMAVLYTNVLPLWIGVFISSMDNDRWAVLDMNSFLCKVILWFAYTAIAWSPWILGGLTVDRCVALVAPLKYKERLGLRVARIWAVSSLVFIALVNSHVLYGWDKNKNGFCGIIRSKEYWTFFKTVFPILNTTMYFVLPFTVIVVGNIIILYSLYRQKLRRRQLAAQSPRQQHRSDSIARFAKLLIGINCVFIFCVLPWAVMLIFRWKINDWSAVDIHTWRLVVEVSYMFLYLNSVLNFFLYALPGSRFRDEVKAILKRCWNCWKIEGRTGDIPLKESRSSRTNPN